MSERYLRLKYVLFISGFSRLDRLLKLIDTAQSSAYRRLAAKQLGSLVQSQPNQARPLLTMVIIVHVFWFSHMPMFCLCLVGEYDLQ